MSKIATPIDGKKLADEILLSIKTEIDATDQHPGLAAIIVGDDPASLLYVRNKKRAAQKVGIDFHEYRCDALITEQELLKIITWLNKDPNIDAIISQLPLPDHLNVSTIVNAVEAKKDVDGFQPAGQAGLLSQTSQLTPPLIQAIIVALESTKEPLDGKHALVISNNPIFSEPLLVALGTLGLHVVTATPDDTNLTKKTLAADILISVVGAPNTVTAAMVKPNAIVIDVGTTLVGEKNWVGDVHPDVNKIAGWLTPVPGGIGPLTVAMLIKNTLDLAKKAKY
jgi:methylenetetrahydrofolate dehydrogenase (NADP+)/methenyltetrahydrofolate cyclohydrolase